MLKYDHPINAELTKLLKVCVNNTIPVYNASMLSKVPKHSERVEFKLINFFSTGQIYETKKVDEFDTYKVGTISEYRCQLVIRVFEDPKNCALLVGKIAGAIQTFQYLEQFVDELYIENETMEIRPFSIEKEGKIDMFTEIKIDCYLGIFFEADVDYFTKLQDVEFEILTKDKPDWEADAPNKKCLTISGTTKVVTHYGAEWLEPPVLIPEINMSMKTIK